MFMTLVSGAVALAAAPVHQAQVQHNGAALEAVYTTQSNLTVKQIAARPVTRQANALCRWHADIVLNRSVENANGQAVAAMGKAVHRFAPISGTEVGHCQDVRDRIEADIARRTKASQAHAMQMAQEDHAGLRTELEGLHATLSKGG